MKITQRKITYDFQHHNELPLQPIPLLINHYLLV